MKRAAGKLAALLLAGILALPASLPARAAGGEAAGTPGPGEIAETVLDGAALEQAASGTDGVSFADVNGKRAAVFQGEASLSFSLTLAEGGVFRVEIEYLPMDGIISEIEASLRFGQTGSGEKEARRLRLPKEYVRSAAISQDNRGNDIPPSSEVAGRWIRAVPTDPAGTGRALEFPLSAGAQTAELSFRKGKTAVSRLRLFTYREPVSYDEYRTLHSGGGARYSRIIQAEDADRRSATVISLNMDRSGPAADPVDPVLLKVNTLGGSGWSKSGQYAVWSIRVPEDGYYRIQLKFRQNAARGRSSYRRILINGEVPFREADFLSFPFSDRWQSAYLGGAEPYGFFLREGENEIRLEADAGAYRSVIAHSNEVSQLLRDLYRQIVLITGQTPDANRDYMLTQEISGLEDSLRKIRTGLKKTEKMLLEIDGAGLADDAATVRTLRVQVESFLKDTETIATRISNFQTNISSFSDFVARLKEQPLELDALGITSADMPGALAMPGWKEKLRYAARAFLGTFTSDYSSVGSVSGGERTVELWVNSIAGAVGRDHAQILKQVIDSRFTPSSGIRVNVKLVQQALAPAIFSGKGPDAAVYVPTGEPVNLAARGGLEDLSRFEGFREFESALSEGACIPHRYNGGVYAVPFTEDFPMLFCRTDILRQLNLTPPKTWDEFYGVLAVLQKNNMTVGIPNVQGTQMSTNNTIFAMLTYQRGGRWYNDALSATEFGSDAALAAFKQWTDFYKNYSLPVQYQFYQRFRLGDMPVGIENYTMATMLQTAAPEIDGLWQMYSLPGIADGAGNINNSVIGGGMCSVMLSAAKDKESAWKLIRWLSEPDAQTAVGTELEAVLGASGRFNPVTKEAFWNLPWDADMAAAAQAQWDKVVFVPQAAGGYYTDRNVTNAFRRTVFYNRNYRESLLEYNREINREIARKRAEFGLD